VRDEISQLLPEDLDEAVKRIGDARRRILREYPAGAERMQLLRDLVYPSGVRV
jgi:siroheme synthase (precorrin-2 oxidase/ferrochelatase)